MNSAIVEIFLFRYSFVFNDKIWLGKFSWLAWILTMPLKFNPPFIKEFFYQYYLIFENLIMGINHFDQQKELHLKVLSWFVMQAGEKRINDNYGCTLKGYRIKKKLKERVKLRFQEFRRVQTLILAFVKFDRLKDSWWLPWIADEYQIPVWPIFFKFLI